MGKKLAQVESDSEPIISQILEGKYQLNTEELLKMYRFITFQIMRVPSQVNKQIGNQAHTFYTALKMESINKKEMLNFDFNFVLNWVIQNKKRDTIDTVLKIAEKLSTKLSDLDYLVADFSTKNHLVFSDNPVIQQNDIFVGSGGLGMAGLIIILPITPNNAFILFDSKIYDCLGTNHHYTSSIESDVAKINMCEIVIRENLVFFDPNNSKDKIIFINKKSTELRHEYLSALKPDDFGVNDEKIVLISNRYVNKKMNLSFLSVKESIKKIKIIDHFMTRDEGEKYKERVEKLKSTYDEKITKKEFENYCEFVKAYFKEV